MRDRSEWKASAVLRLLAFAGAAAAGAAVRAQQADIGVAPVSLAAGSYTFDTAEQHRIRVVVVARALKHPFAVALLPSGDALVAERGGALRLIHAVGGDAAAVDPEAVGGLPPAPPYRNGGLQDVALSPHFATDHLIYLTFNQAGNPPPPGAKPPVRPESRITLLRGTLEGHALTHVETLFTGGSGSTSGSRLAFDGRGFLYMTTGGPFGDAAQRLDSDYGKVLRLTEDGKVPADNPFVGRAGALAEIYSYGHRDHLGLTVHPDGAVLNAEEGPNGGDEVNVILPGHNYGWPTVSFGRNYDGSPISDSPVAPGVDAPLIVWLPSIAPGNLAVYTGERFPAWKNNLFVTSARRGEVPRTGGLERVVLNDKLQELRRETLLTDLHQRLRDVRQGPDGLLYVVTDEDDGALLRIEPAPALAAEPQVRLTPDEIAQQAAAAAARPHRGPDAVALNGDSSRSGIYSQRVSIPAHTRVPPHTHRDDRAVYVVSGTLYVGYGEQRDEALLKALPAGSYYTEPAATAHFTETHDQPVVLLITGFGPSDTHLIGAPPAPAPAPAPAH